MSGTVRRLFDQYAARYDAALTGDKLEPASNHWWVNKAVTGDGVCKFGELLQIDIAALAALPIDEYFIEGD